MSFSQVALLPGFGKIWEMLRRACPCVMLRRQTLRTAGSAGLPQHHLRRVMQFAHDEESVHRFTRGGSRTTRETFERSDRLHASGAIRIRLQDRQRFQFSEGRMVGLCEVHLVL